MNLHSATSIETYPLQLSITAGKTSQSASNIQLTRFSPLTSLPWELQLEIISHLDVRAALQLRRTCQLYFRCLTREVMERAFTENRYITYDLLNCCVDCLIMPPTGHLVQDEFFRPGIWKSMCFRCWRVKRSPQYFNKPDRRIRFVDGREGRACIVCGWPIRHDVRHWSCARTLFSMNAILWMSSTGHFLYVLVITATICLYYTNAALVIIPIIINFLLAFASLCLLTSELVHHSKTSRMRLAVELASTLIWTPPIFYSIRQVVDGIISWNSYPIYIWLLFAAKLLCQALNLLGFLILAAEYDPRSSFLPDLSPRQKAFFMSCSFLARWAHAKYH
ncbi:hypothetical protein F4805DRAFT_238937 [Annulohypoxylon moriforme]|nr:hypothetical protein F4805DRAFT_238937 [Annulohypoxylon moriforme]